MRWFRQPAVLGVLTVALLTACSVRQPQAAVGTVTSPRSAGAVSMENTYPATFVGSAQGGLALFDSTSGNVLRMLTTGPVGGRDGYPTLTGDRTTVYFIRAGSSCGDADSSDGIWAASTGGQPAHEVIATPPGRVDLAPVVSGDGRKLAWMRSTCNKRGIAIFVRDLSDRAERIIPTSPDNVVEPLAWAPDDRHLLIATLSTGEHVSLLDTATAASATDAAPIPTSSCGEYFPRFLASGVVAALTCSADSAAAALALFDPTAGRELRVVQAGIPLPSPTTPAFQFSALSFACSPDARAAIWTTPPSPANHLHNVWRWSNGRAEQLPVFANEVVW